MPSQYCGAGGDPVGDAGGGKSFGAFRAECVKVTSADIVVTVLFGSYRKKDAEPRNREALS